MTPNYGARALYITMPLVDARKLYAKLDALGVAEVRARLVAGAFGAWKRATVEEWLRRTEHLPEPDTYMYHPMHAPAGKLFHASQVDELRVGGWFDIPGKFPARRTRPVLASLKTWWAEWEWLFKAIGVVVAAIAALVGLIKLLF